MVKNLSAMRETWVWSLGWEDPLEKGIATHPSILAWRIPWTRSLVGDSLWDRRVGYDWATNRHTHTYTQWPGKTDQNLVTMSEQKTHSSACRPFRIFRSCSMHLCRSIRIYSKANDTVKECPWHSYHKLLILYAHSTSLSPYGFSVSREPEITFYKKLMSWQDCKDTARVFRELLGPHWGKHFCSMIPGPGRCHRQPARASVHMYKQVWPLPPAMRSGQHADSHPGKKALCCRWMLISGSDWLCR